MTRAGTSEQPALRPRREPAADADGGERRTALVSIAAATALVALKLGTGLVTGSLGLVSAGIESSGDVVAAILTFFAVRISGRPADYDHPYGHRRVQNLSALGEAGILIAGGIVVVVEALRRLSNGVEPVSTRWYVFAVVAVALAVDASRVLVSVRTARAFHSAALRSNAFHFAGDMAGSLAVLLGLIAVRAGFERGDVAAALVVAVIIFAAATRLVFENASVLMDRVPADARERAREAIAALGPDIALRRLRVRESAGRYFADVVVDVPPGRPVIEGHDAADRVEAAVERVLPDSDVVVHVEPRRRGLELRDRVLAVALAEPLVHEAHDVSIFEHAGRASVSLHLKLPESLSLEAADEVAERVERRIRADARVDDVQTHLEPLERPLAATAPAPDQQLTAEGIARIVEARLGSRPRSLRLMPTEAGLVVFLSVPVDQHAGLAEAHRIASELEEEVRAGCPSLAEVVVRTEPRPAAAAG